MAGLLLSGRRLIAQPLDHVLVTVNGAIITQTDLEERQRAVLAQQRGRAMSISAIRDDEALKRAAAALAPQLLLDAIDELLMTQRAEELGLAATDADVDRVIAGMRADNDIRTDQDFARLLLEQGIDAAALRRSVRRQIVIAEGRQQIFRRIGVSDDEAKAFFEAHAGDYRSGPAVIFREIVVNLPAEASTRQSPEAERAYEAGLVRFVKAQDRVRQGESFADVARDLSHGASQATGGAVGPIDPATLPEVVRSALDKLAVGQFSPPVRRETSYLLLRLEGRTRAHAETFETLRVQVRDRLLLVKQDAALSQFMRQLRSAALLSWKDQALEAACAAARQGGDR
jgi:parvulin-like peptidyl-prolyl isomerase